jgi:predicted ABC-type ATPase
MKRMNLPENPTLYLWIPSPPLAIRRIAQRVKMGGHSVPEVNEAFH